MFRTCSVISKLFFVILVLACEWSRKPRTKKNSQQMISVKSPSIARGRGIWRGFLIWNWLSAKKRREKIQKKICQPPPWRQSIFPRPSDRIPMKYGPNSSSSKRLQAMARRDGHLAQRGRVISKNVKKQNSTSVASATRPSSQSYQNLRGMNQYHHDCLP